MTEVAPASLAHAVIVARVSQQQRGGPQYGAASRRSTSKPPSYGPYGSARGWQAPPGTPAGGGYYQGYPPPGFGRQSFWRRSAAVRTDTADACCAAAEESAPVLCCW